MESDNLRQLLRYARKHLSALDWKDQNFDPVKAYCLALFSEVPYYKITEAEHERPHRAKVVPSVAHQNVVTSRYVDFERLMQSAEFERFHIITTRNFVAVAIQLNDLIVVTVRGTQFLYDWFINLNCKKIKYLESKFHLGFCREAQILKYHLKNIFGQDLSDRRIILTGHSLGGAIAAIVAGTESISYYYDPFLSRDNKRFCCYTFAMPRYAPLETLLKSHNPYNTINHFDIVPRVPPTILGFHNSLLEFGLDGKPYESGGSNSFHYLEWVSALMTGRFIDSHAIEIYHTKIGRKLLAKNLLERSDFYRYRWKSGIKIDGLAS